MDFKKLGNAALGVPLPVWIAGLIIPGGFTAIAIYTAWKASRKPRKSIHEIIKDIEAEETKNEG